MNKNPNNAFRYQLDVLFALILGFTCWANIVLFYEGPHINVWIPPFHPSIDLNNIWQLGAEYNHIALAILKGRGFSDPFGAFTGPTAWMPPVLPLILVCFHTVSNGSLLMTTVLFVILSNLILFWVGACLIKYANKTWGINSGWRILVIYSLLLFLNFHWFFQATHDPPFIAGAFMLICLLANKIFKEGLSKNNLLIWSGISSFFPLLNPSLGLVWVSIHLYLLKSSIKSKQNLKIWGLAFLIFTVPTMGWTARNYIVFKKFIPVKSNLFYDAYQANAISQNGILTFEVFDSHPYKSISRKDCDYGKLKETEYNEKYKRKFLYDLKNTPYEYVNRTLNRALAIYFIYPPKYFNERSIIYFIFYPFLGFSILLFFSNLKRTNPLERISCASILIFFLPYVLITFYGRYYSYAIGPETLLIFSQLEYYFHRPKPLSLS